MLEHACKVKAEHELVKVLESKSNHPEVVAALPLLSDLQPFFENIPALVAERGSVEIEVPAFALRFSQKTYNKHAVMSAPGARSPNNKRSIYESLSSRGFLFSSGGLLFPVVASFFPFSSRGSLFPFVASFLSVGAA